MKQFKPGDRVVRTGPDFESGGVFKGREYTVVLQNGEYLCLVGTPAGSLVSPDFFELSVPAPMQPGQAGGLKFDAGKDEWSLLLAGKGMIKALRGVVGILMFGAKKYAAHSWREVEHNERRYLDGLMRHYAAIMEHGLKAKDEESGLLHIDHLNCNGLFLGELARAK